MTSCIMCGGPTIRLPGQEICGECMKPRLVDAEVQVHKTITLTLAEPAARWLKAYLQNPLVENEHPDDASFRQAFFDAIGDIRV